MQDKEQAHRFQGLGVKGFRVSEFWRGFRVFGQFRVFCLGFRVLELVRIVLGFRCLGVQGFGFGG